MTYHGILASAASDRTQIVPQPIEEVEVEPEHPNAAAPPHRPRTEKFSWPQLLQHVFRVDVLLCLRGGRRKVLDFITNPAVTASRTSACRPNLAATRRPDLHYRRAFAFT